MEDFPQQVLGVSGLGRRPSMHPRSSRAGTDTPPGVEHDASEKQLTESEWFS